MPRTDNDRVIALAGLFQASSLVNDIACTGQVNPDDFEACIASLFKIDARDSADVYNGIGHLRTGLHSLIEQLQHPSNINITRYSVELLVLERKTVKQPRVLDQIAAGIRDATEKLQYFPLTHDNVIASLANLYASTISRLTPRIMVKGEQIHLSNPENANRIRALLLAGIRAARLWRQSGGGRLTLMLRRRSLVVEAQRLLAAFEPSG